AEEIAKKAAQDDVCQIANDNDPTQVVLSGAKTAIDRVSEFSRSYGVRRAIILPVSAPFHCSLMEPAARVMEEKLTNMKMEQPVVPVISNVTATPVCNTEILRSQLVEQVTGTVLWRQCVLTMIADGVNEFYEIGVGKVLCGLIGRIDNSVKSVPCGTPQQIAAVAEMISAE
ncbi:MAG: ACP S-malonyltransferase, partial [Hyphomicrobiaceae bacterium]|nr:ACP S-malonyltransferase [Hyphomicrobiaceae bacterium]